jgi:lipopolysaccharide assembly outer membrane protein LptD (OstA)
MKKFFSIFGIAGLLAILSLAAIPHKAGQAPTDSKNIMTTAPSGQQITMMANIVEKDWSAAVVHLKGNVHVYIWPVPKDSRNVTFLRADEVDYFQKTGEFSPRGNVRLTVQAERERRGQF